MHKNTCTADNFFSATHAKRDLLRYRRFGPPPTARKILRALEVVHNRSFIDVGAGVGAVTHGLVAWCETCDRRGRLSGLPAILHQRAKVHSKILRRY